ncbi:helix-turn-helix domain-containing protein [Myroides sp. N17-2]|uniref:helix-turn-helix domain-containing protein n=1 Tax=Myroides sp. N17-2 TaxID=2030799 RepID=UPI000EFB6E07|nr:helix-turn-helix transcriptional regulator [Myroides sp. N17-2]
MPYKLTIGLKLKKKREELDFTVENIVSITGVSKGSVYRVESGTAEDIDFYIKYAIAVKYPLKELMDIDLSMVKMTNSVVIKKKSIYLTKNIRSLIKNNFFSEYRSTNDIREKLLEMKLIDNSVKSSVISNVLINLKKDGSLTAKKEENKNYYKV